MNEKENRDNNLPSIPDVIQHPYLEHLQWGMMSCIRERIKRNGTAEEGGPISSHSLTRGIKRYHVLDASNRTHVTLPCYMHSATMFRTCSYRTCFETIHAIPSQLFVRLIFCLIVILRLVADHRSLDPTIQLFSFSSFYFW